MQKYEKIIEKWRSHKIKQEADLDQLLSNYRILFAYHSNRIEDAGLSIHQTREIFENGKVINYTGDIRALFETQNQKECYLYLKPHILQKNPLTPDFICKIHEILNYGCYNESRWAKGERPGTFKQNYYGVGEDAGILPEDVPAEIQFICDELKDFSSDTPDSILKAAAWFHCNFENIHPFADGNGRTGRTLMNYFLMIHDLPPAIFFEEDKETYYLALAVFDKTEKIDGFVSFIKEQTIKTWERQPSGQRRSKQSFICL